MNLLRPLWYAGLISLLITPALAQGQESPVSVDAVVYTEVVPTMPITGTVFSRNDSQITAGIDGELEFVAEPGTLVTQGEVIARIDPTQLRLQLAEFDAQRERAKAQLAFLETQLERFESLLVSNSAARNEYDETRSNRDVAASDLAIAQSRVAQTRDQLARAAIRAQFGGIITARERREGETVARGAVLGRITDTQQLEVRVLAPLQYSGRVRPGDELAMFGYESTFVGVVRTVVPSVDARTQATELRIDLPEAAHEQWSLGQLVSAAVPLRSARASLAVNRDALILRQDGTFVYRVGANGTAERVAVRTGESAGELVAVEGELAEGDLVVVRGGETLRDGQSVRVVGPAPAA
ncbi:MAG: efflux RND transporter periplasmic adaptor subunit [Pseudomonadota bacterium]